MDCPSSTSLSTRSTRRILGDIASASSSRSPSVSLHHGTSRSFHVPRPSFKPVSSIRRVRSRFRLRVRWRMRGQRRDPDEESIATMPDYYRTTRVEVYGPNYRPDSRQALEELRLSNSWGRSSWNSKDEEEPKTVLRRLMSKTSIGFGRKSGSESGGSGRFSRGESPEYSASFILSDIFNDSDDGSSCAAHCSDPSSNDIDDLDSNLDAAMTTIQDTYMKPKKNSRMNRMTQTLTVMKRKLGFFPGRSKWRNG